MALAGGYPEMRARPTLARRQAWARAYIAHLVERDVQDIAHIDQLAQMPTLLAVLATQCAQLLNYTQLGAQLGLNGKTAMASRAKLFSNVSVSGAAPLR